MRAVLFPGQGSQYVGMGSDFYEKFDLVKKIFDNVDKLLSDKVSLNKQVAESQSIIDKFKTQNSSILAGQVLLNHL